MPNGVRNPINLRTPVLPVGENCCRLAKMSGHSIEIDWGRCICCNYDDHRAFSDNPLVGFIYVDSECCQEAIG